MLQRQLAERRNHVLDRRVLVAAILAAQVVEPSDAVEQVVDDSNNDRDADRVSPNHDNGDDVGPTVAALVRMVGRVVDRRVAGQPAEETEDRRQGVHTKDREDELPRRPGLAPARDEDEPVLGQRNLEKQDLLHGAEVLDDAAVREVQCAADDPSAEREEHAEDDGDDPDLGELPFDGAGFRVGVVVGDGNGGQIGEEGDEDDEFYAHGLVDDEHGGDEVDFEMQAERDTVLNVGLHTLEDLSGGLNSEDDGAETRSQEDDISSCLGGF